MDGGTKLLPQDGGGDVRHRQRRREGDAPEAGAADAAQRDVEHRARQLEALLSEAGRERAQAREERRQEEAREQEDDEVVAGTLHEEQEGEGGEGSGEAADRQQHVGCDDTGAGTAREGAEREQRQAPAEAGARGRPEDGRIGEGVAKEALDDGPAARQRDAGDEGSGEARPAQLGERAREPRVRQVTGAITSDAAAARQASTSRTTRVRRGCTGTGGGQGCDRPPSGRSSTHEYGSNGPSAYRTSSDSS